MRRHGYGEILWMWSGRLALGGDQGTGSCSEESNLHQESAAELHGCTLQCRSVPEDVLESQVASILAQIHRAGYLIVDVNPDNFVIDARGYWYAQPLTLTVPSKKMRHRGRNSIGWFQWVLGLYGGRILRSAKSSRYTVEFPEVFYEALEILTRSPKTFFKFFTTFTRERQDTVAGPRLWLWARSRGFRGCSRSTNAFQIAFPMFMPSTSFFYITK